MLRNIKPLVLDAHRTESNLSNEQRKSLSQLSKLTEEKQIVICRVDKDGKIVILNYEDYNTIMTKELQQFEKWMCLQRDVMLTLKNGKKIATNLWSYSMI